MTRTICFPRPKHKKPCNSSPFGRSDPVPFVVISTPPLARAGCPFQIVQAGTLPFRNATHSTAIFGPESRPSLCLRTRTVPPRRTCPDKATYQRHPQPSPSPLCVVSRRCCGEAQHQPRVPAVVSSDMGDDWRDKYYHYRGREAPRLLSTWKSDSGFRERFNSVTFQDGSQCILLVLARVPGLRHCKDGELGCSRPRYRVHDPPRSDNGSTCSHQPNGAHPGDSSMTRRGHDQARHRVLSAKKSAGTEKIDIAPCPPRPGQVGLIGC